MPDLSQQYSKRIENFQLGISKKKRELLVVNLSRLAFFLLLLTSPFWLYPRDHTLGITIPVVSLLIFIFLIKVNDRVTAKKKFLENLVSISRDELEALLHNFSGFDPGAEFIDPDHINSYDLDLFGKGSLFQFINRTTTHSGKASLASMFINPGTGNEQLVLRQELVAELSGDIDWRHNFAATGMMYIEGKDESEQFERWGQEVFSLRSGKIVSLLLIVLPVLSLLSIAYWIVYKNSGLFILSGLLQSIYWVYEKKSIKKIYATFGKRVNILSKYASLLRVIENRDWSSKEAVHLIENLRLKGLPSHEISELRRIISAFDNRNNFLIGFLLNIVFVWDVLCSWRLIRWHLRNRDNYREWNSIIAFFDAVCSLSNFAFNHPDYIYPGFKEGRFSFNAEKMGHPLIRPGKMISNNFHIEGEKQLVIVTGANMAGKRTFLRTVGVNMVLGMTGAPVCATKMEFVPVEVFSNMRTTDSLFDEESYFFAELKRIKSILDAVESGRKVLIILDEILKGTNSVDKLAGSQKLVKKLVELNIPVIIATHDLKLTEMENIFPNQIQNNCFEITISDDEMFFDYTLREGVTQTMNATFLMKKMGIIS